MRPLRFSIFWLLLLGAGCRMAPERVPTTPGHIAPPAEYAEVVEHLETFIRHEVEAKRLPALSVVLVDDQDLVYAAGFGEADPEQKVPADAETVYRVGSVSKLFTDIAIMQRVEQGELDLDAPITEVLPEFQPRTSFDRPITLRQLMAHRAGIVREPPVGHYFDPTEPSLAATVASLNDTEAVYAPEARTKYSNAGIAVVGYVLEHRSEQPFAEHLQHAVLAPMGLQHSAFAPTSEIERKLAKATMWTVDGRTFEAPTFQLGMAPAGSMYAPVTDLGRFMTVLFNGGEGPGGRVLQPETLEQMWTPQFTDSAQGFGLGFSVSEQGGFRRVGHGGAIYGFATQLYALPEAKLGAAAATSMDVANTVTSRVSAYALDLLLAYKEGRPLPEPPITQPVKEAVARRLAGTYADGNDRIELDIRQEEFVLIRNGMPLTVRVLRGDTLMVDGRLGYGAMLIPLDPDRLQLNNRVFSRMDIPKPAPAPPAFDGLIGEYGWDHNTLFILEKGGRLHALIEWFFEYPLTEVEPDTYAFPDYGLYHGETLAFERGANGEATRAKLGGSVVFERRDVGTVQGETFRITPVRPVDELREEALAASPPNEDGDFRTPDLVDLATLDSTLHFDIRYATTNNFMGAVFYQQPKAFLQRPAAEALARAHQALRAHGYGLLIHDAYRPWYVTKMFWDATPESMKQFVANPATGSRHNRGAAVDLTLYDLTTGEPVQMTGGYDEFSARSYPHYPGGTARQRWHRDLLRSVMEAEGFSVYAYEWWHFDHQDWRQYRIQNMTFEELQGEKD